MALNLYPPLVSVIILLAQHPQPSNIVSTTQPSIFTVNYHKNKRTVKIFHEAPQAAYFQNFRGNSVVITLQSLAQSHCKINLMASLPRSLRPSTP